MTEHVIKGVWEGGDSPPRAATPLTSASLLFPAGLASAGCSLYPIRT